ncbi:LRR receptor-like serine/threonine-protein kinase GSO1 [Prunus avium]|uniref:LRR receptor-like serine/threonine-protein kinase GSO1 n=1 Tax=Prunus avium TaxID=42229 RepID=A0A6P5RCC4_PRUAV|nr:LRR receptor-like serine/threonine-protein kinase GSO1 [Prunus avium]
MQGHGMCLKLFLAIALLLLQCVQGGEVSRNHRDANVTGRCIEKERQALLAFKRGLVDESNFLSSWGSEAQKQDCCRWIGVSCSNQTGHVLQLDLSYKVVGAHSWDNSLLEGKMISPELIELQHLHHLDLRGISFNGRQFPDFIGSLSNLRYLDMSNTLFGGKFPSQVGNLTNLQHLDLSLNDFTNAENLDWLPLLSSLRYLDLSGTNLNNVFNWAEVINKLPELTNLTLVGCDLPSPIFFTISYINSSKSLASVDLSSNQLSTSSIFLWLSNYNTSLVDLDLSNNLLAGSIPDVLGNMSSLAHLNLLDNQLEGGDPHSFSRFCSLQSLDLSGNDLAGSLPDLTNLSSLAALYLNDNKFSGVISGTHISKLSKLQFLDLSWNDLAGSLPDLTNLSSLAALYLNDNKLSGGIPDSIWRLSKLTTIDFGSNSLEGAISETHFSKLSKLQFLDLSSNDLAGSLPDLTNLSSLAALYLNDNKLSGGIPDSIWRLSKLTTIDFGSNSLEGVISETHFSKLSKLQFLDLSSNDLAGSLPDLTNLSSLEVFNLNDNKLSGGIPESIWRLSKLTTIDFGSNSLEGVISETHFSKLSKLQVLDLSFQNSSNSLGLDIHADWIPPFQLDRIILASCKMGPYFPKWLQTQKNFSYLDISDAGISDILPSWFWSLCRNVEYMNLTGNQIRGSFADLTLEFSHSPALCLSSNKLEGPIPSVLSTASYLDLSHNKLSESISFLCSSAAISLSFLDLSSNNFSGQVPDCLTHVEYLVMLDLSFNALSGKIPTTIGSLFHIETLKLRSNRFVGQLPSSLKNCRSLILVDVGDNKLSGPIPKWLGVSLKNLVVLLLSSNHFNGSLPTQICHLTDIQILDFSMNNISGSIPKCLNNLATLAQKGNPSLDIEHPVSSGGPITGASPPAAYASVESPYVDNATIMWKGRKQTYKRTLRLVKTIDLSSNRLTGEIPSEITHLVGLVSLNLSRNQLTSQITPEIGNLQSLDALDLSRNQIEGRIPTSLARIDRLGFLDLSFNNLSGEIPIGTQLQSFDPSVYAGNPQLCGAPLKKMCAAQHVQTDLRNQEDDKDDLITLGFYISMGVGFAAGFWGVCGTLIFKRSWRYAYFKFLNGLNDWLYVRVALIKRQVKDMLNR